MSGPPPPRRIYSTTVCQLMGIIIKCLLPSFYVGLEPIAKRPSRCQGCMHLMQLCLLLSLPSSFLVALQISPALCLLNSTAMVEAAEDFFPPGLELLFNRSRLVLQHNSEEEGKANDYSCRDGSSAWCTSLSDSPIRLELSSWITDIFYTDLPHP